MNATIPRTSGPAVISLVFGIICWFALPFVGAIVAVVCGHLARGEIRRAPPGSIDGDGLALAGMVLGYINLALCVLAVMFIVMFFGGLAMLAFWN